MMAGPAGLALAVLVGAVGLYWFINLVRSRNQGKTMTDTATVSTRRTVRGLTAFAFGGATVVLVLWTELAAAAGMLGELVATFPQVFTNIALLGLGTISVAGVVDVGVVEFLVLALAVLALVAALRRS